MSERRRWFPDQATRLRIYEILAVLLLVSAAGFVGVLYLVGSSREWTIVETYPTGGVLQGVEQVRLVDSGRSLIWYDPEEEAACASNLTRPGDLFCLRPSPSFRVRPIDVLDGDLIVLRSAPRPSTTDILFRGWEALNDDPPRTGEGNDAEWVEPPFDTHLERVELRTGEVKTAVKDVSRVGRPGEIPDVDVKMGRVIVSPDRLNLAWWRAREEIGETPLSAAVSEVFEVLSTGPQMESLYVQRFKTSGGMAVRSRLLTETGLPLWLTSGTCLVLSFLDAGSYVPFDLERGEVQATMPVPMIHRLMREAVNEEIYDPESVRVVRGNPDGSVGLFSWARSPNAAYFFLFDAYFRLARFERIGYDRFDFSHTAWLEQSEAILTRGPDGRLAALTPRGEVRASFPSPPDWGGGFAMLGETADGLLIGFHRGLFFQAEAGSTEWVPMQLLR